ncbi:MAG TPA: carbohydrate-binding protein [Selenomonadales bacterium]|nr:carbohydrate-binding protein [Selenomonadales bacterium]
MFRARSNEYLANGVIITPANPEPYENVTIVYNGLLSKNGANDMYAHVGFGEHWHGAQDLRMIKTCSGFEATIPAANIDSMSVAFHDPANNWDNNSGSNYNFQIKH